jgi:hypothetical protein
LEGREFARKEDLSVVYEGNAHRMAALCADIGEAKRGKVTGSCMNAEKLMVRCFTFIGLLDKHARTYCWSDQKLLALMTLREYMSWCYYTSRQKRAFPSTVCNHEDE